jgi:hypothetical protein
LIVTVKKGSETRPPAIITWNVVLKVVEADEQTRRRVVTGFAPGKL